MIKSPSDNLPGVVDVPCGVPRQVSIHATLSHNNLLQGILRLRSSLRKLYHKYDGLFGYAAKLPMIEGETDRPVNDHLWKGGRSKFGRWHLST